jgi:hypothetical protein
MQVGLQALKAQEGQQEKEIKRLMQIIRVHQGLTLIILSGSHYRQLKTYFCSPRKARLNPKGTRFAYSTNTRQKEKWCCKEQVRNKDIFTGVVVKGVKLNLTLVS